MSRIDIKKVATYTGHKSAIYALRQGFTKDTVISAGGDGWIVEWNLNEADKGKLLGRVKNQLFSLLIDPIHHIVLCGSMNREIHMFTPGQPETERQLLGHKKGVFAMEFHKKYLLSCGGDGVLTKWHYPAMKPAESIALSKDKLRALALHPNRPIAAIGGSDRSISIIHLDTFRIIDQIEEAHDRTIFSLAFHPDNNQLVSGAMDAHISVWDVSKGLDHINTIPAHMLTVNKLRYSPNGNLLVSASRDKSVKLWRASNYELLKVLDFHNADGHFHSVNDVLWADFNDYIISAGDDRNLISWNIVNARDL